jgi:orotidine-5'-phosphate decarboxylase
MAEHFGDRMARAVREKQSVAIIGIDPRIGLLPPTLREMAESGKSMINQAFTLFGIGIIEAVKDIVPAVKPNIAFFEAYGINGLIAYNAICTYARSAGLLVVGDIKRGDIGSTAAAYATGFLDPATDVPADKPEQPSLEKLGPHDCLTLNPYLGSDSLTPFLEKGRENGQGFFVLVKTSNPSSSELQDLELKSGGTLAEASARLVDRLGAGNVGASGLSDVGAVVGATHPDELARYREIMPAAPFLVPGYGAQGGSADDVVGAFRADGSGALVNASRSVIFAWMKDEAPKEWGEAARKATKAMNEDLLGALKKAGKWRD